MTLIELAAELREQWIKAPTYTKEELLLELATADLWEEIGNQSTAEHWRNVAERTKLRMEMK
jgi:hypothetical protein